jgi:hypothetical protein
MELPLPETFANGQATAAAKIEPSPKRMKMAEAEEHNGSHKTPVINAVNVVNAVVQKKLATKSSPAGACIIAE